MPAYYIEMHLSVSSCHGDFELASESTDTIEDKFAAAYPDRAIDFVQFVEFDSNNPEHATAYFVVRYVGQEINNQTGE